MTPPCRMISTACRMSRGCGFSGCTEKYWAIALVPASRGDDIAWKLPGSISLLVPALLVRCLVPARPHGHSRRVQRRHHPRLDRALSRPMVVGSARGEESELGGDSLPRGVLLGAMAAGDHLDRLAAIPAEFPEHLVAKHR